MFDAEKFAGAGPPPPRCRRPWFLNACIVLIVRGAPKGRALPPWNLKKHYISGFLPLNYVIYIFEVWIFILFAMWED